MQTCESTTVTNTAENAILGVLYNFQQYHNQHHNILSTPHQLASTAVILILGDVHKHLLEAWYKILYDPCKALKKIKPY